MSEIHPRVSVNAISSFSWTLSEDIEFWQAHGLDHVGLAHHKLVQCGWDQAIDQVRAAGLRCSCLVGAPIIPLDHPEAWDGAHDELRRAVDGAAAVGAGCLFVAGRPGGLTSDEAATAFIEAIEPVARHAHDRRVPLAFEHTNPLRRDLGFIHTLADGVDFATESGVGLDVELNNCWVERHLDTLFRRGLGHIRLVQVSDFVVGTLDTPNRAVPGDGDIPLASIIGQVLEAGYRGPFDLELIGPRIEDEGYASAIVRGSQWLSDLLFRLGA
ncbi:MAG TPA: TIM barrel protein [Acidimicrobiales bacterium]|nr:TIM barrel protein [Acidimicrobiales bacterium]